MCVRVCVWGGGEFAKHTGDTVLSLAVFLFLFLLLPRLRYAGRRRMGNRKERGRPSLPFAVCEITKLLWMRPC